LAIDSAIDLAVDSAIDLAVNSAVGSAIDSAVGSAVGSAIDSAVDLAVSSAVGSAVGSAIGSAVDLAASSAIDLAVNSAVGSAVGSAGNAFFGGSLWNAGYSAWVDFFNEACDAAIDRSFIEITASAGFCWPLDGVCFASDRPAEIHLDHAGRLHRDDAPAIVYRETGWGLYCWHGYRVPDDRAWIIADKTRITAEAILREPNAEIRRIMCEITAFEPIRRLAKTVSADMDGNGQPRRLLRARVGDEDIRIVEVVNGSTEPDGSRRKFLLGAMPGRTPHEAIAASYGISPRHYREAVRT
jgi:hypothetical protein